MAWCTRHGDGDAAVGWSRPLPADRGLRRVNFWARQTAPATRFHYDITDIEDDTGRRGRISAVVLGRAGEPLPCIVTHRTADPVNMGTSMCIHCRPLRVTEEEMVVTPIEKAHNNAAALIVAAAEKAGLLREVAEALCFFDKSANPLCACALRDEIVEQLDDLICTPALVMESFHGEGFSPRPPSDAELEPYLKIE